MALRMSMLVLWVVLLFELVGKYHHFGTHCVHSLDCDGKITGMGWMTGVQFLVGA
jgi:hypothetical protein